MIVHSDIDFALWILWQILSNAMQVFTIHVKLENLSWRRFAICCNVPLFMSLTINLISVVAYIFFRILARTEVPASTSVAFVVLGALTPMTVILQGVCISFALCRAAAVHDWEQITNPLDFVLRKYQLCSFSAWTHHFRCFRLLFGFDSSIGLAHNLGLRHADCQFSGSQRNDWPTRVTNRIHRLMEEAASCIASFPGKYSTLWEEVTAQLVCSVACVFLTDKTSGLGEHTLISATSNECWCRQL